MPTDAATISLLDQLSEPGFRVSVITSYNCYFPFYEEVVLRRLIAAGCSYNVLMVDATRCAEAFTSEELRPRRAGRDYTLIPVHVGGAFHPKVALRLGRSKASLLVGSHNVTLSGFGLNDEVTNAFHLSGASLRSGGAIVRQALEFVTSFVPPLPELVEVFEAVRHGIPWLEGPLGAAADERQLLTSSPNEPDLWSKVAALAPERCETALVCAPFFDPGLAFVRKLQTEIRPKHLVIGLDPESVEIDASKASTLDRIRWLNIAGVIPIPHRRTEAKHFFHAKLLWFQGPRGELLVTGSANASAAAFFAAPASRNAEAVVADRRKGIGGRLGIAALLAAPEVTPTEWKAVAARHAERAQDSSRDFVRRIHLATPTPAGFLAHPAPPRGLILRGVGETDALGDAQVGDAGAITASELVRDDARYLEARSEQEQTLVVVHRPVEIAKYLGGDARKALQHALGALEEDPTQLDALMKLTEKVIFDADDVVRIPAIQGPSPSKEETPTGGPDSLALDAMGKSASRRRKSIATGDIVVLLDALIRRLGEGLPRVSTPRSDTDADEAEGPPDDEDGGELADGLPDMPTLAKRCRSKVGHLMRRLMRQFESSEFARRSVVQLAAVLGVVRALRIIEQRHEWCRTGETLVERDRESSLFEAAVLALAWGDDALANRAATEGDAEPFEEMSMALGLLGWLAWDVGVDVNPSAVSFHGDASSLREATERRWRRAQLLGCLAPWLAEDAEAWAVLAAGVAKCPQVGVDGDAWLARHREALDGLSIVASDPDRHLRNGRRVHAGDLVMLSSPASPRLRVVVAVRPGPGHGKVVVFDPAFPGRERVFLASHVATAVWAKQENGSRGRATVG